MMTSDYIKDVSEADFDYEVIAYSAQIPVVVDFWAEWCVPCKVLSPVLEQLTDEAQGKFRLAKIDVDANPNLARRFNIRSIPAVKAFQDGQIVAEFTGVIPEPKVREFLKRLIPTETQLLLEKAESLLDQQEAVDAEIAFRKFLETDPSNQEAVLGMAKSLLLQGRVDDAQFELQTIHGSREYSAVQALTPLVEALVDLEKHHLDRLLESENPLDPAFYMTVRLISKSNLLAALDGLLDILRQDKRYGNGGAHKIFLGILELMGENNPDTRSYRKELTSILF